MNIKSFLICTHNYVHIDDGDAYYIRIRACVNAYVYTHPHEHNCVHTVDNVYKYVFGSFTHKSNINVFGKSKIKRRQFLRSEFLSCVFVRVNNIIFCKSIRHFVWLIVNRDADAVCR